MQNFNKNFIVTSLFLFLKILTVFAQNDPKCGIKDHPKNKSSQLEIVNGKEAVPHEFPWAVSLGWTDSLTGDYLSYCTASLIHPQWLLTAGHCNRDDIRQNALAVVAVHNVSYSAKEPHKKQVNISKIISHPEYNELDSGYVVNDLALVKLVRPLKITPDLGTICLPPQDKALNEVGKIATVIGWGETKEGVFESWSKVLRKVALPVAPLKNCQKLYQVPKKFENTFFCTVTRDGKDACQGDSGGPLMLKVKGQWTVIGVTSFGNGCGKYDGAFTHVSLYSDWIWKTIKEN